MTRKEQNEFWGHLATSNTDDNGKTTKLFSLHIKWSFNEWIKPNQIILQGQNI